MCEILEGDAAQIWAAVIVIYGVLALAYLSLREIRRKWRVK